MNGGSKQNKGYLYKNSDKTDEHPDWVDYRGSINVGGTGFWIDAWVRTSQKGTRYLGLSIRPKQQQAAKAKPQPQSSTASAPYDDGIPF